MNPSTAAEFMRQFHQLFLLFRDERTVLDRWEALVIQHGVCGKESHDTRLVAAMLRHGIEHLVSFNASDFRRYRDIQVLTPEQVVAGADF